MPFLPLRCFGPKAKSAELNVTLHKDPFSSDNQDTSYTYGSKVHANVNLRANQPVILQSLSVSLVVVFDVSIPQDYAYAPTQVSRGSGILYKRTVNAASQLRSFGIGESQTWDATISFPSRFEHQSNLNKDVDMVPTRGYPNKMFEVTDSRGRVYARFSHELRVVAEGIDASHRKVLLRHTKRLEFSPSRTTDTDIPTETNYSTTKASKMGKFHFGKTSAEERRLQDSLKNMDAVLVTPTTVVNGDKLPFKLQFNNAESLKDKTFNLLSFEMHLRAVVHLGDWDFPKPEEDVSYRLDTNAVLDSRFGQDLDLSKLQSVSNLECTKTSFSTKHVSFAYHVEAKAQIECAGKKYEMVWPGRYEKLESLPQVKVLPRRLEERKRGNMDEVILLRGDGDESEDLIFLPRYSVD